MSNGNDFLGKPSFTSLGALAGKITDGLAKFMNKEQVDYWNKNQNQSELMSKLCEVFSIKDEYLAERQHWQDFYKEHFDWTVDFSRVLIPKKPGEFWRLIFIAKGMKMNKAMARCKDLFETSQNKDDFDASVTQNIRTASENYAVWVRDGLEPDHEFLGKSTKEADPDMKIGITLLERIILEIKYFSETGNHLDLRGLTFCSGSRGSDGHVPSANWFGSWFRISWYGLDGSDSDYGVRSAISL